MTQSKPRKPLPKLSRKETEAFLSPDTFSAVHLGRRLWAKQREIALSVERHTQTTVKGCHASGKTFVASGLPLYRLIRHRVSSKVFVTAPTLRQVKTFWGEIAMARSSSKTVSELLPEPSTIRLQVTNDRYAFGASSSRGVNVQGLHAENVLIICDEAPGIEPDIWDAIEGIRAGGHVNVLKLGNPVVPIGEFFDSFTRSRAIHNCISISAFDTPNLQNELIKSADPATGLPVPLKVEDLLTMSEERLDWAPYPFLITRRWVKERYIVWGPNHPKFRSRVLAEFPQQSPYAVFELAWIEKAKRDPTEKEIEKAKGLRIQVGIDVAGPGDDETTLTARVGGIILCQHAWHDSNPKPAVLKVLGSLQTGIVQMKDGPLVKTAGLGNIVVDVTGIGYYFARGIVEGGFRKVYGFNASQAPVDGTQYKNGKSEAYFQAREYFRAGEISGLMDEECEAQLTTMLYHETDRGLTEIRSKEYMREEVKVPSPDRAESLINSLMRVVPKQQGMTFGGAGTYEISPI